MEEEDKYFYLEDELRNGDDPINEYFDIQDDATCLDGWFTLEELKRIVNAMETFIRKKQEENENRE